MKNCHLVKHVSLELETVARPHMLQQVDNLLTTTVLLSNKYLSKYFQISSHHWFPDIKDIFKDIFLILLYLVAKLVGGEGEDSKVARELWKDECWIVAMFRIQTSGTTQSEANTHRVLRDVYTLGRVYFSKS